MFLPRKHRTITNAWARASTYSQRKHKVKISWTPALPRNQTTSKTCLRQQQTCSETRIWCLREIKRDQFSHNKRREVMSKLMSWSVATLWLIEKLKETISKLKITGPRLWARFMEVLEWRALYSAAMIMMNSKEEMKEIKKENSILLKPRSKDQNK